MKDFLDFTHKSSIFSPLLPPADTQRRLVIFSVLKKTAQVFLLGAADVTILHETLNKGKKSSFRPLRMSL